VFAKQPAKHCQKQNKNKKPPQIIALLKWRFFEVLNVVYLSIEAWEQ